MEYAGEVIRAVLADQREKRYEAMRGRRGVAGCYMFRIDDNLVVDATLKGNAARFINHSCDVSASINWSFNIRWPPRRDWLLNVPYRR